MWVRILGISGLLVASCAFCWWANNTSAQPPEDDGRPRAEGRRGGDGPPRSRDDGDRDRRPEHAGPERGGPGDHRPPPRPPRPTKFARALDSDRDGVISAAELKDAVAALQKLDQNDDGELTPDEFELPPPPPPRDGAFGRRGDRRGPPPPPRDFDGRGPRRFDEEGPRGDRRPPRAEEDDRAERPADDDETAAS